MITPRVVDLKDLGISLILLIFGIASFRQVLDLPMTALDSYPIIAASQVENIWELPSVLSRELRDRIDPEMSYYRPLELLTYSLDYLVWELNPKGYHQTNLCLHALAGVAVFWAARVGLAMRPFWAVVASLLFLLHPATVEVVPAVTRRQEPLLVIGFALAILGARGVVTGMRFGWMTLIAGTVVSVTSVERGLMVPAIVFSYFLAFGGREVFWSRLRSSALRSLPSGAIAVGFFLLRSTLFQDSRIDFEPSNLLGIPALAGLRTLYPQEFLGRLRADSPMSGLVVAAAVAMIFGAFLAWLVLRSGNRRLHLFALCSAASVVMLFSIAGLMNSWYIYSVVPFMAISLSTLLEEGIQQARSGNRRQAVTSVLVALFAMSLMVVPSPLFIDYPGWRIAGDLGEKTLSGIRELARSLPDDTAIVVINTPLAYVESRSDFVETRDATILYPKSVRTWAQLNDIHHEIVVFGVSQWEGELSVPEIDFTRGGVRIYFESELAQYIQANDPHVKGIDGIPQGVELVWPPQDLVSEQFQVYVFDGEGLVPLETHY